MDINDPSNVRLLRIGLDLWPASEILQTILNLLRPFTEKGGLRKAPRRIAWYCLSEILRAGATETGFVTDSEALPDRVDLNEYRAVLGKEAARLISQTGVTIPWYLKQQALLYLAANPPAILKSLRPGRSIETRHYRALIRFLLGESRSLGTVEYATYAIAARRSFLSRERAIALVKSSITPARISRIATLDPNFGQEIVNAIPQSAASMTPRLHADLGTGQTPLGAGKTTLAALVLSPSTRDVLRNEISLLSFAAAFLKSI